MLSEEEYRRLREDHEVAHFRADLALSDPEGYSLEEKAEIIEGMRSSTEEVERAMREDFESMPPETRRRMFEMLASSGPGARGFWSRLLLGWAFRILAPRGFGPRGADPMPARKGLNRPNRRTPRSRGR